MSTSIFLGYPPENIKNWIINNYKPAEPDMLATPLHFTANEDNSSVSLICYDEIDTYDICDSWCELEYSMTGKDSDWSDYTTGQVINLNKGKTVYFRAKQGNVEGNPNLNGFTQYDDWGDGYCTLLKYHFFKMEGSIKADGNIQFLLENTGTKMDVPGECYTNMFSYCTSLTQAPSILPAMTLANGCYHSMFSNCTSLIQAPELPATTLANYCYSDMFYNCESLTTAPELPAETLVSNCYNYMFNGCSILNNINVSFTDWDKVYNPTLQWLFIVASEGTFTCPADLPEERGESYIPEGWTIVRK